MLRLAAGAEAVGPHLPWQRGSNRLQRPWLRLVGLPSSERVEICTYISVQIQKLLCALGHSHVDISNLPVGHAVVVAAAVDLTRTGVSLLPRIRTFLPDQIFFRTLGKNL